MIVTMLFDLYFTPIKEIKEKLGSTIRIQVAYS